VVGCAALGEFDVWAISSNRATVYSRLLDWVQHNAMVSRGRDALSSGRVVKCRPCAVAEARVPAG
jgi:hypothetical protein